MDKLNVDDPSQKAKANPLGGDDDDDDGPAVQDHYEGVDTKNKGAYVNDL